MFPSATLLGNVRACDHDGRMWVSVAIRSAENQPAFCGEGSTNVFAQPYPMGYFSRALHGRIDDPSAGWKGRGLWSAFSPYTLWHVEGGKGTRSKLIKFQVRPDPLAR